MRMNGTQTTTNDESTLVNLTPKLGAATSNFIEFCRLVAKKTEYIEIEAQFPILEEIRSQLISDELTGEDNLALKFAQSLVLDLVAQGWQLTVDESEVFASPPNIEAETKDVAKQIIRNSHLIGRDAQLRETSVQDFIRGMERRRLTKKGWFSIYSLMRDGKDLAERLRKISEINNEEERIAELSKTVSPYLQFVDPDDKCEITGLRLGDIWRYFRHTWVNEYKSVPGRSIMILIRDSATPNHPVMGIAALGSSVVQHKLRDKWIGWQHEKLVDSIAQNPTKKLAHWLLDSLERLIGDIYIKDLIIENFISSEDLSNPSSGIIEALKNESEVAIKEHRKEPQRTKHNGQKSDDIKPDFWEKEARTFLYRSKRCKQLSKLLNIRRVFLEQGLNKQTKVSLIDIFNQSKVKNSMSQLVRMIKAEHVGVDMMDITVCGAIAPYNHLIGGKLVCMLLCSPEMTQYYNERYSEQTSIIASGMKGESVTRKPNLVLLCTTSLYGVGSSQYNRVKIPLKKLGIYSKESVIYKDLGHSYGFGTYHFSKKTIELGNLLNSRKKGERKVNSIFGEGVNPLMRKIRESINSIGLDSENLLLHGNKRVTYGIQLARNFRNILLGIERKPNYLVPQKNAKRMSDKIASYWIKRWLAPRIQRPEILSAVEQHTLNYPINHGAIVPLPTELDEESENLNLFDE